jgi:predicted RND superfamily exporter protein
MIEAANKIIEEEFPPGYQVTISGSLASDGAITERMVNGKVRNIIQICVFTIAIASTLLRSILGGALVAIPLAFSIAVIFGVMGLFGIPLDVGTAAIAAMAVGIGIYSPQPAGAILAVLMAVQMGINAYRVSSYGGKRVGN